MGRFSNGRMRFRDRMIRFFYGRNGNDSLCSFLTWTSLIVLFVALFVKTVWLDLTLTALGVALLVWSEFRMLSRNLVKRRKENATFCRILRDPVKKFFSLRKSKWKDRKTHIYRKCPKCKNTLRLPKKKGEHTVCCPCCKERFGVKVR